MVAASIEECLVGGLGPVPCARRVEHTHSLGHGTTAGGAKPATNQGHLISFGNTEERLKHSVLGSRRRGTRSDGKYNHRNGTGHVPAHDGDYADAMSKVHGVLLLMTESTGALAKPVVMLLRALARLATLPSGNDTTVYGSSRASPKLSLIHI